MLRIKLTALVLCALVLCALVWCAIWTATGLLSDRPLLGFVLGGVAAVGLYALCFRPGIKAQRRGSGRAA
jgi:hypothetical protein